jgi:hypothetical protein
VLGPERAAIASLGKIRRRDAGWSSQVARRAHNPKVAGSNPAPAIRRRPCTAGPSCFSGEFGVLAAGGCRTRVQDQTAPDSHILGSRLGAGKAPGWGGVAGLSAHRPRSGHVYVAVCQGFVGAGLGELAARRRHGVSAVRAVARTVCAVERRGWAIGFHASPRPVSRSRVRVSSEGPAALKPAPWPPAPSRPRQAVDSK